MTFNQFRAFAEVAKSSSITRAAKKLHITQPCVSRLLKLLEEEYNVTLFARNPGGGMELTQDGREFLVIVESVLEQLDALEQRFKPARSKSGPSPLRVGGNYRLTAELLPLLASEFKRRHPKAEIALCTDSSARLQRRILEGSIDIAVITKPSYPAGLAVEPYLTHRLVFFVPQNHRLALRPSVTLAEVVKEPLIVRGENEDPSTSEKTIKERGHEPNIDMRCESPDAVEQAVRRDTAVGILYYDCVKHAVERGELKVLNISDFELRGETFIVYPKGRSLSGSARDFLALMRQWKKKIEPSKAVNGRRSKTTLSPCPVVSAGWAFLALLDILF